MPQSKGLETAIMDFGHLLGGSKRMSKKSLSDLIVNFDPNKKSGGFIQKKYEPATQLTKKLGKKVNITPGQANTQAKVDYKKEYEQLIYKDLYKKIRPQPKDMMEPEDVYKRLAQLEELRNSPYLSEADIAELSGEIATQLESDLSRKRPARIKSATSTIPSNSSNRSINSAKTAYSLAQTERSATASSGFSDAPLAPEDIEARLYEYYNRKPYPVGEEVIFGVNPRTLGNVVYNRSLPSQEVIDNQQGLWNAAQSFDRDALESHNEYYNNPSNFAEGGKPQKAYLPEAIGEFEYIEQPSQALPAGARPGRGRHPSSQKNILKAHEARRVKSGRAVKPPQRIPGSASSTMSSNKSQSSLILPSQTEGTSGRGLKKKATCGGKISVSNLSKFFKSSYAGKKAPKKIDTYNLDSELTNKYGSVYYDPDKQHAVLTHKGTSGDTYLETAKDWGNNAMYAVGLYKYTDRYKQGKKLQDATEKKYGANNVSTLGHSQGSTLSRELGQNSKEIINLNPAYKGEKPLKNEYNIRSSGDVVSVGLHGTKRGHDILIPSQGINPLTEHKIDILDRIDQSQMVGQGLYNPRLKFRK
jgi:hypothetical protein